VVGVAATAAPSRIAARVCCSVCSTTNVIWATSGQAAQAGELGRQLEVLGDEPLILSLEQ
jgi:hypothetical protein